MVEKSYDLNNYHSEDPRQLKFGRIMNVFHRTCAEMQAIGFELVFIPKKRSQKTIITPQVLQLHYDGLRISAVQYEGHNHIHD